MGTLNDREIRPLKLLKKYNDSYIKDIRILKKNKLVTVHCPACTSKKFEKIYIKMGFNFVICKNCSTLYVNPRPSESSLEEFYTNTKSNKLWNQIFEKTKKTRKNKIFKPRIKMIQTILKKYNIKKSNTLVEVGAGYGWFCELAKENQLATRIIAIEPSKQSANVCRKIKHIEVIESTIEKNLKKLHSDLIVTFETAHLLFDPRFFFQSCYDHLTRNGILIFSLTNYQGFDIQILQEKSDYIIPTFLNLFNPNSIKILLESIGFRKIEVTTPGQMDVNIILTKINEGQIALNKYPFFKFLLNSSSNFIDDFQQIIQKNNLSSHMVVSAQK